MRFLGTIAATVFLIVIVVAAWYLAGNAGLGGSHFQNAGDPEVHLVTPLLMAALMLCGIVFGAVYNELQQEEDDPRQAVSRALRRAGLYRALLVAPIVFAGVYSFVQSNDDPIIIAIFAFQNGFFCEAIFRKTAAATAGLRT